MNVFLNLFSIICITRQNRKIKLPEREPGFEHKNWIIPLSMYENFYFICNFDKKSHNIFLTVNKILKIEIEKYLKMLEP